MTPEREHDEGITSRHKILYGKGEGGKDLRLSTEPAYDAEDVRIIPVFGTTDNATGLALEGILTRYVLYKGADEKLEAHSGEMLEPSLNYHLFKVVGVLDPARKEALARQIFHRDPKMFIYALPLFVDEETAPHFLGRIFDEIYDRRYPDELSEQDAIIAERIGATVSRVCADKPWAEAILARVKMILDGSTEHQSPGRNGITREVREAIARIQDGGVPEVYDPTNVLGAFKGESDRDVDDPDPDVQEARWGRFREWVSQGRSDGVCTITAISDTPAVVEGTASIQAGDPNMLKSRR